MGRPSKVPRERRAGFLLPVHQGEIDAVEEAIGRFRSGEMANEEFRPFRLQRGIYGQRQPENQMVRVKLPGGGLTSEQMEALGTVAEELSGLRRGHLTTRENVQFHFVPLERTPALLRLLATVGLTTREACGNTVRNVTGCPRAGVCQEEPFDPTPYLVAYARYMLYNPVCQALPRKFKTAFSGCETDCAGTPFHDLGFVARVRPGPNGGPERGFQIRVGGGTSTMPRQADVLDDFVPVAGGEYLRRAEAILRVFDRLGQRKNRMKARIKFLLQRLGAEEFRRLVEEELQQDWAKEPVDLPALMELPEEKPTLAPGEGDGVSPTEGFARWSRTNTAPQRQGGYRMVAITVPQGDLTPEQFRGLAQVMRRYGGHARANQNQNLVIRWVPEAALARVHRDLLALGLGAAGAGGITDVVSCPGADSCSLAITSSMGLARAVGRRVTEMQLDDPLAEAIPIKVSGCPNGCGQHHLGAIGFQGASVKVGKLEVPAYELLLGGGNYVGAGRFGARVLRLPAKQVPEAVQRIVERYRRGRRDGEEFLAYVDRVGPKSFVPLLKDLQTVGSLAEESEAYMDWDSQQMFSVQRGEGECAV